MAARTTLMTSTFFSPAASSMTVNSVCSSHGGGSGGRGGHGNSGSGGGNAELLFHLLDQLGQIENGHAGDGVEDFCFANSHD